MELGLGMGDMREAEVDESKRSMRGASSVAYAHRIASLGS
jgi:hypothetical protein